MATAAFHACATFRGPADGYVFQNGPKGVGYYLDTTALWYAQQNQEAEQQHHRRNYHARQPEWPRARMENANGEAMQRQHMVQQDNTTAMPTLSEPKPTEQADPVLEVMHSLLEFANRRRSVDIESVLREAGSPRDAARGIISKVKFMACLKNVVQQPGGGIIMADGALEKLALKYGCGPVDIHNDGFIDVAWRTFVQDLMALKGDTPNHRKFY